MTCGGGGGGLSGGGQAEALRKLEMGVVSQSPTACAFPTFHISTFLFSFGIMYEA